MPRFKPDVQFEQMHSRILAALPELDDITRSLVFRPAYVTSAREGKHSVGSLHYEGRAIDLRTRDMTEGMRQIYAREIRKALGDAFDVVLESNHLHVEYDPRFGN